MHTLSFTCEQGGMVNSLSALTTLRPDIPLWQTSLGSTLLNLMRLQALVITIIPLHDILRDSDFTLLLQAGFLRGSEQHRQCINGTLARRSEDVR